MSSTAATTNYRTLLQEALVELQELRAAYDRLAQPRETPAPAEPIAIIGASCRFPGGADTLPAFWHLLHAGRDTITKPPLARQQLVGASAYGVNPAVPAWGGFLEQVDHFDAAFFNLAPVEVEAMDPQQRLLLETHWEALEHAGIVPATLRGSQTGIYVGISTTDYMLLQAKQQVSPSAYFGTGTAHAAAAGRLAYYFGLQGPALAVDTACSSSLVAVHLACQSLQRDECTLALASGVNLLLAPELSAAFAHANMLAPDGRCKTFDAAANGYVRSEGCGVVVLKRLRAALADNDPILAVIRGSAINQDGASNGLTAPNGLAQQAVIRQALSAARLKPRDIAYVEAHGTGTALGDPIEVEALTAVYQQDRAAENPLMVGSVKTNLGHTEAAAGIAGLLKVVLALQQGTMPAHLHFQTCNPHLAHYPIVIPTTTRAWQSADPTQPRRAGISSFGFSGSNAHIIVEEFIPQAASLGHPSAAPETPSLILLSARNEPQLQAYVHKLLVYLEQTAGAPALTLANIAYTLQMGREAMEARLAFVVSNLAELRERLCQYQQQANTPGRLYAGNPQSTPPVAPGLFEGETGRALLKAAVDHRAYEQLAQLWVAGMAIDWRLLYGPATPRRIALPTYPFARQSYWFATQVKAGGAADVGAAFSENDAPTTAEIQTFRFRWQPAAVTTNQAATPTSTILLLYHTPAFAAAAQQILVGRPLILVKLGHRFAEATPLTYEIAEDQAQDYVTLFTRLLVQNCLPTHVVYQGSAEGNAATAYERPGQILHHCAAALTSTQFPQTTLILLYGRAEQAQPALLPAQIYLAALGGLVRSLALGGVTFRTVCVEAATPTAEQQLLALATELTQVEAGPLHEVRYHNQQRYHKVVAPLALPAVHQSPLKKQGVYWLTGGAGALGMIFARYLAAHHQAILILTGRTAPNEALAALLAALRQLGATQAVYLPGDVADQQQMQAILAKIKATYGQLDGVIHAAGSQNPHLFATQTWAEFAQACRAKIGGALTLDDVTKHEALAFFVLFSSTAAVVGDFGQGDYALANRFLDELAQARAQLVAQQQRSGQSLSINWPLWREGGMHLSTQAETLYLQSSGQQWLPSAAGLHLFEASLNSAVSQVIAFCGDPRRIQQFLGLAPRPPQDGAPLGAAPTRPALVTGLAQAANEASPADVQGRLLAELKHAVTAVTKIPSAQLPEDENLGAFGFDSILLKQLAVNLTQRYGIAVTPTLFFEYSTLKQLASFLLAEHPAAMLARYQIQPKQPAPLAAQQVMLPPNAPAPTMLPAQTVHPEQAHAARAVAIIGISGILPQSPDLATFWQHLVQGDDLITEIPPERWDWRAYAPALGHAPEHSVSKWGGFIPDVDKFDAAFFKLSPREAAMMDPQHRLFLQTAWHAIEDAGYRAADLAGRAVGVYVGVQFQDYQELLHRTVGPSSAQMATGNAHAMLANRLSFLLDLRGPSEAIETACSSSLVALHRAVQSIRNSEVESAIVGGVSLALSPATYITTSQLGVLSPDGRCKPFDKRANGYVKGEGVGAVLLKPLAQAEADGDPIYAVIRGSAENHGGRATSLTAPNAQAQAQLLVKAYTDAGVDIATVSYIETHGTGTELGDPVEVEGLRHGFAQLQARQGSAVPPRHSCGLGSVKSNIGHLEPAAGLAGVFKVLLALQHQTLPATLHVQEQNPYIDLNDTPFYLVTATQAWPTCADATGQPLPRRAGVSSFGFGGANAHVVIEEYLAQPIDTGGAADDGTANHNTPQVIVLSARNEERLRAYAQQLLAYLSKPAPLAQPRDELTAPQQVLQGMIAELLGVDITEIGREQQFAECGLDVVHLNRLQAMLQERYQCELASTLFTPETSLAQLAQQLCLLAPVAARHPDQAPNERPAACRTPALARIAYTLQVGREAMAARLALIASDRATLCHKLTAYLAGEAEVADLYWGQTTKAPTQATLLLQDEDMQAAVGQWLHKGKLSKLAQWWVAGGEVDWRLLHGPTTPRRVALPTYPFARERYWLPEAKAWTSNNEPATVSGALPQPLHPLVQQNVSTLTETRFRTTLSGHEFFLRDHLVQGAKMLPGVAYLEMARAAAELAGEGRKVTQVQEVVWHRPLVVNEGAPIEVRLSLVPTEQGDVQYTVQTQHEAAQPTVHSQGRLLLGKVETVDATGAVIDLAAIRQRCPTRQSGAACYQAFQQRTLAYGPAFQVIEEVISNATEALACLRLPDDVAAASYRLHPSFLDGALQGVLALLDDHEKAMPVVYLPFALDAIEIIAATPTRGYAYITRVRDDSAAAQTRTSQADIVQFNLALLDEAGHVCLKLHKLTLRALPHPHAGHYYLPTWVRQPLSPTPPTMTEGMILVVVPKARATVADALGQYHPPTQTIRWLLSQRTVQLDATTWEIDLADEAGAIGALQLLKKLDTLYFLGVAAPQNLADRPALAQTQEQGIISLFRLVKLLEQQGRMAHLAALKVVTNQAYAHHRQEPLQPWGATLSGFTLSLAKEYPAVAVSTLDVTLASDEAGQPVIQPADCAALIAEHNSQGRPVLLRQGVRYGRQLIPVTLPPAPEAGSSPYRPGGVYLILGGASGIGLATAHHLAQQAQAKVVLVGRSPLTAEKAAALKGIERAGGAYLYCQADGSNHAAMAAVVRQAKATFGALHGVIHSALVLKDRALHAMDEATLRDVLAPKVQASVVLAEVVKDELLDFLLFYSSGQSFWGNAGQSNYAAAGTFQDAYALYLNQVRPYPVKVINWGFWGAVGVVATPAYRQRLTQQGVQSIAVAEGMAAFDQVLAAPLAQVAFLKLDPATFAQLGIVAEQPAVVLPAAPSVFKQVVEAIDAGIKII